MFHWASCSRHACRMLEAMTWREGNNSSPSVVTSSFRLLPQPEHHDGHRKCVNDAHTTAQKREREGGGGGGVQHTYLNTTGTEMVVWTAPACSATSTTSWTPSHMYAASSTLGAVAWPTQMQCNITCAGVCEEGPQQQGSATPRRNVQWMRQLMATTHTAHTINEMCS